MKIKNNIELIRANIVRSASKVGRNPNGVTLVGVSKRITKEMIIEAYNSGLVNFGENYGQEFRDKYTDLQGQYSNIKWHFIGHLQRNKIKYVIGKVFMIHSVDSLALAKEINDRSARMNIKTSILIEINSGGELTKTGISFTEAEKLIENTHNLKNITLRGVMTMSPYNEDPEASRPYFKSLKLFSNEVIKNHPDANEISMGMSGDYEVAVEEGATIVRIGSAIFGSRDN